MSTTSREGILSLQGRKVQICAELAGGESELSVAETRLCTLGSDKLISERDCSNERQHGEGLLVCR